MAAVPSFYERDATSTTNVFTYRYKPQHSIFSPFIENKDVAYGNKMKMDYANSALKKYISKYLSIQFSRIQASVNV